MRTHAFLIGAAVLAASATTASAQGYDWGGGACVGFHCVDEPYARPARGGYRTVQTYEEYEARPRVRIEERRVYRTHRHVDWDDDDDLD